MRNLLINIGKKSKIAFLDQIDTKKKNKVLKDYYQLILKNRKLILNENIKDIKNAQKKKLKNNLLERLILDNKRIFDIITSIKKIIKLKDPTNIILEKWKRPNGLDISKISIPIGVIGVIYESRPNVTSDVASLCFKSGNAVILKGGSEAYYSNSRFGDSHFPLCARADSASASRRAKQSVDGQGNCRLVRVGSLFYYLAIDFHLWAEALQGDGSHARSDRIV